LTLAATDHVALGEGCSSRERGQHPSLLQD